jgi:hypothetical protein
VKKTYALAALILISLILVGCKPKLGEVHGIIVDSSGNLLEKEITVVLEPLATFDDGGVGISIEYQLFDDDYQQRKQVKTVENGEFIFLNVEPGPYSITVDLQHAVWWGPAFQVEPGSVIEQRITGE